MKLRLLRLVRLVFFLRFAPLALVFLSPPARAQDLFAPSGPGEEAHAPSSAAAPSSAPADADEWWRAKPPSVDRRAHPPKPLALRFDGAYAPRRLFALGVTGADLGLALGVQTTHHSAWWATSRLSLGSTENGLSVWSGRAGAEVEVVVDPVRIGVGAGLIIVGVDRAARDETLHSFGVEVRAFGRVDCVRNDDYALFLRAGIDAGALTAGRDSVFWGPALGVGIELGVRGKRPEAWTASGATSPRSL